MLESMGSQRVGHDLETEQQAATAAEECVYFLTDSNDPQSE